MRSSKTAIFGNSYATSKDLQKIVLLNFYCKLYSNQRNNLGNISKYYCFIRFHYPVACNEYEYTNVTNYNTDKKTQDMLVKFDFKISNFFSYFGITLRIQKFQKYMTTVKRTATSLASKQGWVTKNA